MKYLLSAACLALASVTIAQPLTPAGRIPFALGSPRGNRPAEKIPLCDPLSLATITGATVGTGLIAANPLGIQQRVGNAFIYQVDVTSVPSFTGLASFHAILQNSCDDGQTWNDVAHLNYSYAATFQARISTVNIPAGWGTGVNPINDGSTPSQTQNLAIQGPVGDMWRLKYGFVGSGTVTSGAFTFQAFLIPL
jgi:hypothetical protein